MLGNINKLITKITSEKARGGVAQVGSPSHSSSSGVENEQTTEGFLCPYCMEKFISPEELQSHYEATHSDMGQHICPICKDRFATGDQLQIHYASDHASSGVQTLNGDLQMLKHELAEMQTTLREERWYSEELKKEVTRLGGVVQKEESQETLSIKQQIKALEETKSLLTSEIVLLRKQLGEAVETHMVVKQQKDSLEQRIAQMTSENSSLLSKLDEECSLKQSLEKEIIDLKTLNINLEDQIKQKSDEDESCQRKAVLDVQVALKSKTEENNTLAEENEILRKRMSEFAENVADEQKMFSEVKAELDGAKKELERADQENSAFTQQNKELLAKHDNFLLELNTMKEEEAKKVANIKRLGELRDQLQSELDNYKEISERKYLELNENLIQISAKDNDKEMILNNMKKRFDDIQLEFQKQTTAFDDSKLKYIDLKMEFEKEKRLRLQLETRAVELQSELDKQVVVVDRLNQEREELYSKIEAGEGTDMAIQQLQLENAKLSEKISEQQNAIVTESKESNKKIEDCYTNLLECKRQLQISDEKVLKLESTTEELSSKLNVSEERCQHLENTISDKMKELGLKEASWSTQKMEIIKQLQESQENVSLNNQLLVQSKESCSILEQQVTDLNNQLNCYNQVIDELHAEIGAAKGKCDQLNESLEIKEVELKEQICNVENIRSSFQEEVTHMSMEKSIADAEIRRIKHLLEKEAHSLLFAVSDAKNYLVGLKRDCNHLKDVMSSETKTLSENLNFLTKVGLETQQQLSAKLNNEVELQANLQVSETAVFNLKAENESLQHNLEVVKSERDNLHLKRESCESILNKQKCDFEAIQSRLGVTQSSLNSKEESLKALEMQHKETLLKIEHFRVSDEQSKKQLVETEKSRMALEERLKILESSLFAASEAQQNLNLQKTSLETELSNVHETISNLEDKYAKIELANTDLENLLISTKADMQNQITQLEEARDFLIAQKLELSTKLSSIEGELQQEKLISEGLHKSNEQMIENLQKEIADAKSELNDLHKSKKAVESKVEEAKTQYEMQVNALQENLSTVRSDMIGFQEKVKLLETQNDDIMGEKLELEAKLENAIDERRALLERCLSSEADCEKLRNTTSELRRKLDDALSALHELGRENQTLQMETAKLTNRKWTNDSEADNCAACQKIFSVTFRKHHCRNCGNIYCNECSAKTATITAYKKPVRVCDGCYNEITK